MGKVSATGKAQNQAKGKLKKGPHQDRNAKFKGKHGQGRKKTRDVFKKKPKKRALEAEEIELLKEKIAGLQALHDKDLKSFRDFPLCSATQRGLAEASYTKPTLVQRDSLKASLFGRDVLGAAKTGSGKTLAFLIPLLERLFAARWSRQDGMGALVISPTRELAQQTFETLNKIGKYHDFSAGLVIGGTDHNREAKLMATCNIVICTPGRLLQHMDSAPDFHANNMEMLVLDEADRCLEVSFADQMNAILANLPRERQTLLFSATQTRSVRDLARLSLRDPVAISPDENSTKATPDRLVESYIVCPLEDKLDLLANFLKLKKKKKIIVFVASCKQAKYYCSALRKVRVPTVVLGLYGTLKQYTRMAVFKTFCESDHGALIATDLASRGLDFPTVDWVLQLDCPKDWQDYQHRVGRTARNQNTGQGLLVLQPGEEDAMVKQLRAHKIPIKKEEVNRSSWMSVKRKLAAFLAADENLKHEAERAFSAYLRSIFLMKNKLVFDVTTLDTNAFSESLGMAISPKVKFLRKDKNQPNKVTAEQPAATVFENSDSDDDDDDGMLTVKRKDHDLKEEKPGADSISKLEAFSGSKKVVTKAALAKKVLKKIERPNQKFKFDADGEAVSESASHFVSEVGKKYEKEASDQQRAGIDLEAASKVLRAEDAYDLQVHRERVREKHREAKRKEKEARRRARLGEHEEDRDEESSEDEGPNLDWLPDPDKVYGMRSQSSESGESEEEEVVVSPKRSAKRRRRDKAVEEADDEDDLENLEEDEDLALRLLQS